MLAIAITPEITHLLGSHAPIAIGVSGGKDSDAAAFATTEYLDQIGHRGPRLLIHSDLGRTEWAESLPQCERLAERLGIELVVVRRQAGDMLDRWLTRWSNNVERYAHLECVKLILPWSTSAMRFCTSELKTAIICRELVRRFPTRTIVNVAGIRREESLRRKRAPICKLQPKLQSITQQTTGYDWLPLLAWIRQDVFALHQARGFPLHPAYRTNSRVSCVFCTLASQADLRASTTWPEHQSLYREMVDLEIISTFAFQENCWLSDLAPQLLSEAQRIGLAEAKRRARAREAIEGTIPRHLLYTRGWPTSLPTAAEARLLAGVRRDIGQVMSLDVRYTDADAIQARYAELMEGREVKVRV
jgi:3'-phosphoadenosine 5'-phosphosulfate sulfotransferase (PAPS reductase)/FAD synthetase